MERYPPLNAGLTAKKPGRTVAPPKSSTQTGSFARRGGVVLDQICLALPILPGKTEAARQFQRELDTDRKADYDRSERRVGITKEVWNLASLPSGDHLAAYLESADFNRALQLFAQSQDEFDLWFKRRLAEVTGVDLNNPPPDMKLPELVSHYEA
jgi:hypothetical protein